MLVPVTLEYKNVYTKSNGDKVLDLTQSSIRKAIDPSFRIIMVTDEYQMRPDLISKTVYGHDSQFDFILKYNGISNPFSIQTGDLLLIPNPEEVSQNFVPAEPDIYQSIDNKVRAFIQPANDKENKRLEMLKTKTNKSEMLPPNINKEGDKNIKFKDGRIVFGEDVTTVKKENCPDTYTRAKIKEQLIKSKLFI